MKTRLTTAAVYARVPSNTAVDVDTVARLCYDLIETSEALRRYARYAKELKSRTDDRDKQERLGRRMLVLDRLGSMQDGGWMLREGSDNSQRGRRYLKASSPPANAANEARLPTYNAFRKWIAANARNGKRCRWVGLGEIIEHFAEYVDDARAVAAFKKQGFRGRTAVSTPQFLQAALGREFLLKRRIYDLVSKSSKPKWEVKQGRIVLPPLQQKKG